MRRSATLASRASSSSALANLPEEIHTHPNPNPKDEPKIKLPTPLHHQSTIKVHNIGSPVRGKPSPKSQFKRPNLSSVSNGVTSFGKIESEIKPIDHQYISQILSRKDWFLLLKHEVRVNRIALHPRSVVSILQNQENALHNLKFYIWISNFSSAFARNQSVQRVLANSLFRKGPVPLSAELIRDIRSSGCRVTEDVLCVLISSWGRLGLAKYCADVFSQISYLGLSPTTRLYNAVIDALIKSNSLDLAYLKFQQMPADNCVPDRYTYNILIHGVCKVGVIDEALRLVKQMEGLGCSPNVFTYTILLDGFCNAKRVDEAFKLLDTMKERNVSPNDATYRSLVNGVFRCVSPCEAFELLSKFLETQSVWPKVVCDTLLDCLSSNSLAREASEFMRRARRKGYFPDSSTLNMAVTCLINGLDLDETCEILDGLNNQRAKLGFNTYLALVKALYGVGRVEDGNRYLNLMIQDGLLANVCSYNMVIDCFSKAKLMDRALETFSEMQLRGIAPNLVTFNTLISGHCKSGEVSKARDLLVLLLEKGLKPDIITFTAIIDGLCRVHQISDAFDCFTEMVEWGITPNSFTYNILIRALCAVGDVAKAMKLMKKMEADGSSPDVYSFNALIQCFCKMNKVEKAQNAFGTMMTLGLCPDNFTYCAFLKALCESGRYVEAKNLFFSMEANGCIPDAYTCKSLIDALIQFDCFQEAQEVIKKFGSPLQPTIAS